MKAARVTPADLPEVLDMARAFWAESPTHRQLAYNDAKVVNLVAAAMEDPDWLAIIVRGSDGALSGMALFYALPAYFSDDLELADLAFYVAPGRRGGLTAAALLRAVAEFGREKQVKRVTIGINTGINHEQALRFFAKAGFGVTGYLVGQ